MINYCLCAVWKKALQTKYVVNFSNWERERKRQQKHFSFFVWVSECVCAIPSISFYASFMLISLRFVFLLSSIFFSSTRIARYAAFLSLIVVFSCIFFASLSLTHTRARPFVSVVFQHPLMALSITFHLFIILLTNSHPHTHSSVHILRVCPSSSSVLVLLLFQFHSIHRVNWML